MVQFPQADGTEVQGPAECLIQAKRPLQEAAEPATAPQAQKVAKLMAGDLRGTGPQALPQSQHPVTPTQGSPRPLGNPGRSPTPWVTTDPRSVIQASPSLHPP